MPAIGTGVSTAKGGGGSLSRYWTTRYISNLSVSSSLGTTQTVLATIVGTGYDGVSFEYSTDNVNFSVKGTSANGTYNATGLTADTLYYWRARLYKESNYGNYSGVTNLSTLDTNASAYVVAANIVNQTHRNALNVFIKGLKADSLWDKVYGAYWTLSSYDTLTGINSAKVNLKSPGTYDCTDYLDPKVYKTGMQIRLSAQYLDTGYTFPSANRADKHFCVYHLAEGTTAMGIGANGTANGVIDGIFLKTSAKTYVYLNDANNKTVTPNCGIGCYIASRLNGTNVNLWVDKVAKLDNVASNYVNNDSGKTITLAKVNGQYGSSSDDAYWSFGAGLTAEEAGKYDDRIKALKTAWDAATFSDVHSGQIIDITPMTYSGAAMRCEAVRGSYVMGSVTGKVLWSTNGGTSFSEYSFTDAKLIVMAHIFGNGNVIFATSKNELWFSSNGLTTITQKTLKAVNGIDDYVFHTPVNASYPGRYFLRQNIDQPQYIGSDEVLVFGSYSVAMGTMVMGATPNLIYHFSADGNTCKVSYIFGQNATYKDDGTKYGGATGNLLGDAGNPIVVVHVHNVIQDQVTKKFYAIAGETAGCWLEGVYNSGTGVIDWTKIIDIGIPNGWFKAGGVFFDSTKIRVLSDGSDLGKTGVYEADKASMTTTGAYTKTYNLAINMFPALVYGNTIIAGHLNDNRGASISIDGGVTWYEYSAFTAIPTSPLRTLTNISYPNNNGYFTITPYAFGSEEWFSMQSYWFRISGS